MDAKEYCTIYVIRHGQTEWNTERRLQGQKDSPLTEEGKNQARQLAQDLSKIKFDAIFSSDLLRAQRTAEIIALEHQLAVTTHRLLREKAYGRWEGMVGPDYEKKNKKLLDKFKVMSDVDKWNFKVTEDVESYEEVISRVIVFLREVAITYIGKTVLVVTHGAVMRSLLVQLGFASFGQLPAITAIANGAHIKLSSDGVDFFIDEIKGITKIA